MATQNDMYKMALLGGQLGGQYHGMMKWVN